MKYPIDGLTTETFFGHLIAHDRAQRQMIQALTLLLTEAMNEMGMEDTEWYDEAKRLMELQKRLKVEHENRMFNAKNGHPDKSQIEVTVTAETGKTDALNESVYVPGVKIDPEMNARLNESEKGFGEEMSEEDLAAHFRERTKKNTVVHGVDLSKKEPFKGMTLQEIESWEAKQDNSNDIYKIKARVQNLVAGTGGNLTAVGEMMVNSFVHMAKDLYNFAENVQDRELRIRMIEQIRKHENMPASLIAAVSGGVRVKK